MRIAFVGSSHVHTLDYLAVCKALPWVDVVGIAHVDPETQRLLTDLPPSVPTQPDLPPHDLAVVLTDIASHDEICARLEAPAVFLEKPLAVDGPRADKLARSLSEKGKRVEVGFFLRHSRALSEMIEAVQKPAMGPVRFRTPCLCPSGATGRVAAVVACPHGTGADGRWHLCRSRHPSGRCGAPPSRFHSWDILRSRHRPRWIDRRGNCDRGAGASDLGIGGRRARARVGEQRRAAGDANHTGRL